MHKPSSKNLTSLSEIRSGIDAIDNKIVSLLSERYSLVKEAAKFKKNADQVADPVRVQQVIDKVKLLAINHQLPPVVVEVVYLAMIRCFIELEQNEFINNHGFQDQNI